MIEEVKRFEALRQKMQRQAGKCGEQKVLSYEELWKSQSANAAPAAGVDKISMLQESKSGAGFTAHVAATGQYDDEHSVVHVGLNIDGQFDDCLGIDCVTVCW